MRGEISANPFNKMENMLYVFVQVFLSPHKRIGYFEHEIIFEATGRRMRKRPAIEICVKAETK